MMNTKTKRRRLARQAAKKNGFIAITSILLISAVLLTVSAALSLRSISESDMGLGEEFSNRTFALANACAEDALLKLRQNLNYSGNENIIIEGGDSCAVLALEGSGNANRVIKTEAALNGYKKKIKIEIASVSPLQIAGWKEIGDF